jgi:CDP-diacylglycerol pyrophosphatase
VKIYEDVNFNVPIAEKIMIKYLGNIEHPMAQALLDMQRKGQSVVLEISPKYYSTWDYIKQLIESISLDWNLLQLDNGGRQMKSHYDPIPTQVDSSFLLGRRKDSHELINRASRFVTIATMI